MEVHVHWVLATEELIASQVVDNKFFKLWDNTFELLDFGFVLESGQQSTPEITIDDLIKLLHLKLHLGSFHGCVEITWLGLVRPHWNTFGTLEVRSKLGNNSRLEDDVAIRCLKERHEPTINLLVPLSLDSEIDIALLELNVFGP